MLVVGQVEFRYVGLVAESAMEQQFYVRLFQLGFHWHPHAMPRQQQGRAEPQAS